MKTLILNGSPRKDGNTVELVNYLSSKLTHSVKVIDTYFSDVSACTDCRYCCVHKKCCLNDSMQDYYNDVISADNIVIASPLYFSELTGSLLSFASRFQLFFSAPPVNPVTKKGAVILVGGGSSKTVDKAVSTASIILKGVNCTIESTVSYINTDKSAAIYDTKTLASISEMATILNQH